MRTTVYTLYFVLAFSPNFTECSPVMNSPITFRRRIGLTPQENNLLCVGCRKCPDIWELDNGDFAIIGKDITDAAVSSLPDTAGCGPEERIVRLPRNVLVNAKTHIPDSL